ncbi:hypothetical protein EEL31_08905 [Brevibacillus laterosporus]|nr:hypothetical protein [Brevibacillus laterosporus]TPG68626.1 hypothetical protein EEL31_08905 [Brevibacillus laterosporus]
MICNRGYCKSWADDHVGMYAKGEECPACASIIKEAKKWFGMGEYDVDAMIRAGVVEERFVVNQYRMQVLGEPSL